MGIQSDRYEIGEVLGHGSFATVFRALDKKLRRNVAIKVIKQQHLEKEVVLERGKREFQSCVALRHPHIIKALDFISDDNCLAIVLEYIEAESIEDLLAAGPLPVDEAVEVALAVADALAYLHQEGLLHRDIKPANVMRENDGRVILMDFNLVYDTSMTALTQTGFIVGTPMYLAPELLRGETYSELTDIYSLGLLLWECLAGDAPEEVLVSVKDLIAIGHKKVPSIKTVAPHLPAELCQIVDNAMEASTEKRTQSAAILHDQLLSFKRSRLSSLSAAVSAVDREELSSGRKMQRIEGSPSWRKLPAIFFVIALCGLFISYMLPPKEIVAPPVTTRAPRASDRYYPRKFIRVIRALRGEEFIKRKAIECKGDNNLCLRLIEADWAEREVLHKTLAQALNEEEAYWRSDSPWQEKLDFFNALSYLRRLDVLLISCGSQAKSGWQARSKDFVHISFLQDLPWHWRTGNCPQQYIRHRFEGRDGFMLAKQPKDFERKELSLLRLAEDAVPRRLSQIQLSKEWLAKCENGRATLFMELRSNCPEGGFELEINKDLVIPCWQMNRSVAQQSIHYLIEFPARLLRPGENSLSLTIMTAAPHFGFGHGTWRSYALLPGGRARWLRRFQPSARRVFDEPPKEVIRQAVSKDGKQRQSKKFAPSRLSNAVEKLREEKVLSNYSQMANRDGRGALLLAKDDLKSRKEFCLALDEALDRQHTFFASSASIKNKAKLFNALAYLTRLDALFVTFGEPPFSSWQARSSQFVTVRLAEREPFLNQISGNEKKHLVIRKKYNLLERSLVPKQVASKMSKQISFAAVLGRQSHKIVEKLPLTREWLNACDGNRVTMALVVRIQCPDNMLLLSINDLITVPLWTSKGSRDVTPRYFALELPAAIFEAGENTFKAELHSLSLKRTLRGGAWPKYYMAPGPLSHWRNSLPLARD